MTITSELNFNDVINIKNTKDWLDYLHLGSYLYYVKKTNSNSVIGPQNPVVCFIQKANAVIIFTIAIWKELYHLT